LNDVDVVHAAKRPTKAITIATANRKCVLSLIQFLFSLVGTVCAKYLNGCGYVVYRLELLKLICS